MDVIETLADVMLTHSIPEHIRFDNGPERTAQIVRGWLHRIGTDTLYTEPGSLWRADSANRSTVSGAMNS